MVQDSHSIVCNIHRPAADCEGVMSRQVARSAGAGKRTDNVEDVSRRVKCNKGVCEGGHLYNVREIVLFVNASFPTVDCKVY